MAHRLWTTHHLRVEDGHIVRQVRDWTALGLSAELELMRADLAEAVMLLNSRQPWRAAPILTRNGIPTQHTQGE